MEMIAFSRPARKGSGGFRPHVTVLALPILLAVSLTGCGGSGGTNTPTGASIGSGNGSEKSYGTLITRAVGTTQEPVLSTSADSLVTGIAGADFTSIVQRRSPDSVSLSDTQIAYFSSLGGPNQIFTVPAAGGDPTQITSGAPGKLNPIWLPGGLKFAYNGPDANGVQQIFTMPATGGTPTQLTTGSGDKITPAVSGPGAKIAFQAPDSSNVQQIFTIPTAGGTPTQITTGSVNKFTPTWSPIDAKIAYSSPDANGYKQIYWTPATGGTPTALTTGNVNKSNPSWSPNGVFVAYNAPDSSNVPQIFTVSTAGGGTPNQITTGGVAKLGPCWSPDGSAIAFVRNTGFSQICTVSLATGAITQVTAGASDKFSPSWSPYLRAPITLIGTGGLLGTNAAGFLFSHDGNAIRAVVAFDTAGGNVASRSAARIVSLTPASAVSPTLLFSITASDALTSLAYCNYDASAQPQSVVSVPLAGGTTSVLVAFNAKTGIVATVLPYTATKNAGSRTAQVRSEGNTMVISGSFSGVYDAAGTNHAPHGAHAVRLDAATGNLLSAQ